MGPDKEGGGEELTTNAEGTSAGDGLGDDEAVKSRGSLTIGENGGGLGELWDSSDAGVFFVHLGFDNLVFGSADGWEDEVVGMQHFAQDALLANASAGQRQPDL